MQPNNFCLTLKIDVEFKQVKLQCLVHFSPVSFCPADFLFRTFSFC